MRHVVLTRSAYGPAWNRAANLRRLRLTEAVTARLMRQQYDARPWTWIVLLDERDPFLRGRMDVFEASAPQFVPLIWTPPDDPNLRRRVRVMRSAAADYRAPWRSAIGPADEFTLMTRLDDDDGLTPDALRRYQQAACGLTERTVLMLPRGVRVWANRYSPVRHDRNAMHTLVTPPGDEMTVYDYGHTRVRAIAPVVDVDQRPGWLWVRHRDTISGWHQADRPLTREIRRLFPVDWSALRDAWRVAA